MRSPYIVAAQKAYDKATKPHMQAYQAAVLQVVKSHGTGSAEWSKVCESAWSEYVKAVAPFQAAYEAAVRADRKSA